ncbi:ABC transporter permease [Bacteroides sp. 51]|uniref:ABC transporter permease n=1 Tax=Bacteroides sp. 51 TaxID=2302938 RepID=UPI0013D14A1C|nr:FtsX-like permease family protein [Bacteroides sp. 51]NDV81864.1 ABC transporter permease [Bacteroides sp. 51]
MIKLMLKQIWNEKKSNIWLWVELLIVFVALWFIVDWSYVYLHTYNLPKGFNIENTYQLLFNELTPKSASYIPADRKTTTDGDDFLAVVERLRHHPDIEYVCVAQHSSPYNGSNSGGSLRQDTLSIGRLLRRCTPDFFNVFQYQNVDGTGSTSLANAFEEGTIIVPSDLWEDQYPGGKNLLGQEFYQWGDSTKTYRVAAISEPVRYSDFSPNGNWSGRYYAMYFGDSFFAGLKGSDFTYYEVCIRTRPGTSPEFTEDLMKDAPRLYNVGNCYIQSIQSYDDIRYAFQLDDVNALKKRGFIMLFLLVNIFLGIIGTFWYRTQQRRSELGLRIALGSSLPKLNRLLISEGLLLLLLAVIPALVICYNIGNASLSDAWQMEWGMERFIPGVLITLLLMTLMIVVGIWYPAYQAMKIQPAEALHEE